MQAARSVGNNIIGVARPCGLDRIVNDGSGIGTLLMLDKIGIGAPRPDFQLVNRCCPERVARRKDYFFVLFMQSVRQFCNRGRFPDAINANDQVNGWGGMMCF